jgi:hypothetical protein
MENSKLIKDLNDCADTCDMCYNACLNEEEVAMMARCIELDRECADICRLTSSVLSRDSENRELYLRLCGKICQICADECAKHDNDHCRKCSKTCQECAEMCAKAAA